MAVLWHMPMQRSDWWEANLGKAERYDRDVEVCESSSFGSKISRVDFVACSSAIECANDVRHVPLLWLLSREDKDEKNFDDRCLSCRIHRVHLCRISHVIIR